MAVIYVGCALKHAPEEFKQGVKRLKELLAKEHTILEFVLDPNASDEEVFLTDIGNVEKCDLFLAITDLPSSGLGLELGFALTIFRKPTLCVYSSWDERSRIIHGTTARYSDLISFVEYRNLADVAEKILPEFLRKNTWRFAGRPVEVVQSSKVEPQCEV